MKIHTFPVPSGMSVEQAWEHLSRGEGIPGSMRTASWANIAADDGGKLIYVLKNYRYDEDGKVLPE